MFDGIKTGNGFNLLFCFREGKFSFCFMLNQTELRKAQDQAVRKFPKLQVAFRFQLFLLYQQLNIGHQHIVIYIDVELT
ncbi:hypothetical protein D3C86_1897920 [compost metagenome]